MLLVEDFYKGNLDIQRLNYGAITLVPKVKDAFNVRQFRPICLLNVSFKIFFNLLMNRFSGIADRIIDKGQTAFIKGRYILDGVVILHETLHELRRKKMRGVILKIDFKKAYDSVKWDFVEKVLRKKGFDEKVIGWIMSTVKGGKVCININGENRPYFKTHRGLRQGDPLSPLLFNLVGDALAHMLNAAKLKGRVKGLVPHLIEGGLTHLQYADDTILFMEDDESSLANVKFILYCFEWMTGLRINYHKSDVYTFGLSESEQQRVANTLKCKVGEFPMIYLGIPVSDRHLGINCMREVPNKLRRRLQLWKSRNLTSGGRLILSNSSLSSLPIYTMGMYNLQEGIHQEMDSIRGSFFGKRLVLNLNTT